MVLTKSPRAAITSGVASCALGLTAIALGDHHTQLPFKALVVLGVALTLCGLIFLRYSWAIRRAR